MAGSIDSDAGTTADEVRMTVQQALEQSVAWLREGRLDAVETVLMQILRQKPDEPNTLNLLSMLRHRQGRSSEAIDILRRITELLPGAPEPWLNLGNILIENDRHQQAIAPLLHAIELDPASADACNNLGLAYLHCDRVEESDAIFRRGLAIAPQRADLHQNYARMLRLDGRRQESVEHSLRALEIDPDLSLARQSLCFCYYELGELEHAAQALRDWHEKDPDDPEVRHLLGAVGALATPERAADDYVAEVFDEFADSFDRKLSMLNYRAPQLVANALAAVAPVFGRAPDVLDAGCGTGLCGPLVKPMVGRLVGIDLSQGMLGKAKALQIYDELVQAELTAYLRDAEASCDIVISADTLCYFGALADVFAAARLALREHGYLIFSVEAASEHDTSYQLQINGRYKHGRDHVIGLLRRHGFAVAALQNTALRSELDVPVAGWIVTAVRVPGAAGSASEVPARSTP
ncbi:tetratricopeptide repeat protein [Piscinibacter sakaiensis]|uniref:tetratricopeptide repeat protein n=1 Tax=Piscinibacter sakaiensis TaxID=1547922 RepID=UPI003AAF0BAE